MSNILGLKAFPALIMINVGLSKVPDLSNKKTNTIKNYFVMVLRGKGRTDVQILDRGPTIKD